MKRVTALLLTAIVALAGCASKSYVVLLEDPQGGVGKVILTGMQGTQSIEQAMHAGDL